MKLFSYQMSDKSKTYDFYMTNKAKKEIEEKQMKQMEGLGNSDIIKSFMKTQRLKLELSKTEDEAKKDEINEQLDELQVQILPHISEVSKLNDIDLEDMMFVLLKNHRQNLDITDEEFNELLADMEETLGFKEYNDTIIEIASKVFTLIREVTDHKEEVLSKAQKKKEMSVPMS